MSGELSLFPGPGVPHTATEARLAEARNLGKMAVEKGNEAVAIARGFEAQMNLRGCPECNESDTDVLDALRARLAKIGGEDV